MREMLEGVKAGDNIKTIGGIYGKVVSVKEDLVTIETGPEKAKSCSQKARLPLWNLRKSRAISLSKISKKGIRKDAFCIYEFSPAYSLPITAKKELEYMPSSKAAAHKKGANGGGKLAVGKAVKGAIFGLIVTVVLSVLVLAIIVKQFGLSDEAIAAVNQAVKVIAILSQPLSQPATWMAIKSSRAALRGALYVLLGFGVFSLIEGQWGSITQLLADLAMGLVIGMLTAMIFFQNFRETEKTVRTAKR